ncbi:MAG TPA: hypothetical protein VIH61_07910 [Waddliaceae bacterium]
MNQENSDNLSERNPIYGKPKYSKPKYHLKVTRYELSSVLAASGIELPDYVLDDIIALFSVNA